MLLCAILIKSRELFTLFVMEKDIISLIKEANLLGRGGAGYPAWKKWEAVKKETSSKKYVVCNASEGEPDVFKDEHIIKNYPQDLVYGIKIAMDATGAQEGIIYLNENYFNNYADSLRKAVGVLPVKIFKKTGRYIGGEETAALNTMEGKFQEPRSKPPYPTQKGLWGCPTLVNNVETLYYAGKIAKGEYKGTRLYSISGDALRHGVFELPVGLNVEQVLRQTENYPDFKFFAQIGGGVSGEIFLQEELAATPVKGAGAIVVYNKKTANLRELMIKWAKFFAESNCDKCTPCREGTYRILEMVNASRLRRKDLEEVFLALDQTSFCPLGRMVSLPFKSLLRKMLK